MHYAIAALIFGAAVVFVLPWFSTFVSRYLPAAWTGNILVQVLISGGILIAVLILAHKAGLGKYLRAAHE